MKKILLTLFLQTIFLYAYAGVTTYQFLDAKWGSVVGSTKCDGVTDGWVSDKDGYGYCAGYPVNEPWYSIGVEVKKSVSGAGATSVKEFTKVRRIVFNLCQNASSGKGVIYVQVGESEKVDSLVINKPASGVSGTTNRDSALYITNENATGKIKFWVTCTENGININTISIYAEEGGSNPFTMSTFQLVTDASQLQDSDQIIIGVAKEDVNYVMGYFDEFVSKNNVHAIKCRYGEGRATVAANDYAIYTLRKGQTEGTNKREAWYIQDELRYDGEAYLVAGGGQTKNKLTLWNNRYNRETFGDYGYWDITIAGTGVATIKNLGNSKGIYLQYNASNSPTLFSCYESANSQTPVCIYREVQAIGNVDSIVAPMTNFGELVLSRADGAKVQAEQTITIQANGLTENIQASLKSGEAFSLGASTLDRDGDNLKIRFEASAEGTYEDVLVLTSGSKVTEAVVMARVIGEKTVSEVKALEDYSSACLGEVVVTKKFDKYIYVRDATGSMLIYDNGDGTGKRYGASVASGDVLVGVRGKYLNYYGVPELQPTAAWKTGKKVTCEPEVVTTLDSADVCRYVRIPNAVVEYGQVTVGGKDFTVVDAFDTGITTGKAMTLDAIVSYDHDEVVLKVVKQELPASVEETEREVMNGKRYDVLGREVDETYKGVVIVNGKKLM